MFGVTPAQVEYEPSEAELKAARRANDIRNVLFALKPIHRRCLEATYNQEYRYPVEVVIIFGAKTGALLCTTTSLSLQDLTILCRNVKLRKLSEKDQKILFMLRVEADKLYHAAHSAYRTQCTYQ